jgi:hypothetical protein
LVFTIYIIYTIDAGMDRNVNVISM